MGGVFFWGSRVVTDLLPPVQPIPWGLARQEEVRVRVPASPPLSLFPSFSPLKLQTHHTEWTGYRG